MGAVKEALRVSALLQVYVCEEIAGWRLCGYGLSPPPSDYSGLLVNQILSSITKKLCFELLYALVVSSHKLIAESIAGEIGRLLIHLYR